MNVELLLLTCLAVTVSSCDFPDFLQNKAEERYDRYRYRDTQEGFINEYYSAHYVRIVGNILKAGSLVRENSPFELNDFNWTCVEQNGRKYIVKENDQNFLCVSFIQRSESVIQLKKSARASSKAEVSCEDVNLSLDPWPLFRGTYRSVACPSIGGFWVDFYDNKNTFVCGRRRKHGTRMEFECTKNEGIYFDFSINCPKGQRLFSGFDGPSDFLVNCRAVWKEGIYTYIAASRDASNWIFRYKTIETTSNEFDVYLFKDAVADTELVPSKTSNFLRARVTREIMDSLCLDYLPDNGCDLASCDFGEKCPKTCRTCSQSSAAKPCSFKDELWGDWLAVKSNSVEHMRVNANWVNFTDYEKFKCLSADRNSLYRGHTSMYKLSSNGCSPRYACMKTNKIAPSVLEYELGRPLGWTSRQICSSKQFEYNRDPSSWNLFTSENVKRILVNENNTQAEKCDLNHIIYTEINITSEIKCDLKIHPDDDHKTQIKFSYTDCSDGRTRPDSSHTCLRADVRLNSRNPYPFHAFWIAMKNDQPDSSSCIILKGRLNKEIGLVIVPTGECLLDRTSHFMNLRYVEKPEAALEWLTKWPEYRIKNIEEQVKPTGQAVLTGKPTIQEDSTKDDRLVGNRTSPENTASSLVCLAYLPILAFSFFLQHFLTIM